MLLRIDPGAASVPLLCAAIDRSDHPRRSLRQRFYVEVPRAVNDKLKELDQKVAAAQYSADNAWMLVSAALVLMMTGPGLALFYGGLVRQKNVLAIMMQSFALMALITVLWALVGLQLMFRRRRTFYRQFPDGAAARSGRGT